MTIPLVSVIIPTYNRADLLKKTVGSVLAQTEQDFEIIVVDDASTDNTEEVVRKLQDRDPRIFFHELAENSGGAAAPKNLGIKKAQGKFIATLDADDLWYPDKLHKQLNLLQENPNIDVVGCAYKNIRDGGAEIQYIPDVDHNKAILIKDYMGPGSCIIYKKEVFEEIGGFDPEFRNYQDWDMRIRLAAAGKTFGFVNNALLDYIVDEQSISNRSRWKTNYYLRLATKKHWDVLIKNKRVFASHLFYLITRHIITLLGISKTWMFIRNRMLKNKTF